MSDQQVFDVPASSAARALINAAQYEEMYRKSVADNAGFWGEQGRRIDWIKPYTQVKDVDYTGDVRIRWYHDGVLNVSANCIDRHLPARADQTALDVEYVICPLVDAAGTVSQCLVLEDYVAKEGMDIGRLRLARQA